jgi:hypothetical protein
MPKTRNLKIIVIALAFILANFSFMLPKAFAGTLTKTTILEIGGSGNPMIASGGEQLAVDFDTSGAGATTASINFNNFSGGSVNATQSISSTGCTTYFPSATLLPGGSLAASGSGNTISITGITALSATHEYCTILTSTSAVTNPGTPGVYSALVTAGSDSQNSAFDVLASATNTIGITGTVAPSFTMALSGCNSGPPSCTDTFPSNLSSSALTVSNGVTVTVNTNAPSGWNLYAKDTNAGLTSASAGHTIPSTPGTICGTNYNFGANTGAENYGLGVSANGTTNYAYTTSNHGSCLATTYNQIATSSSPANGVTQVLHELANISPTTQPGADYTDTVTVIGTGSF